MDSNGKVVEQVGYRLPISMTLYRPEYRAQSAAPIKRKKLELVLEVVVGWVGVLRMVPRCEPAKWERRKYVSSGTPFTLTVSLAR